MEGNTFSSRRVTPLAKREAEKFYENNKRRDKIFKRLFWDAPLSTLNAYSENNVAVRKGRDDVGAFVIKGTSTSRRGTSDFSPCSIGIRELLNAMFIESPSSPNGYIERDESFESSLYRIPIILEFKNWLERNIDEENSRALERGILGIKIDISRMFHKNPKCLEKFENTHVMFSADNRELSMIERERERRDFVQAIMGNYLDAYELARIKEYLKKKLENSLEYYCEDPLLSAHSCCGLICNSLFGIMLASSLNRFHSIISIDAIISPIESVEDIPVPILAEAPVQYPVVAQPEEQLVALQPKLGNCCRPNNTGLPLAAPETHRN